MRKLLLLFVLVSTTYSLLLNVNIIHCDVRIIESEEGKVSNDKVRQQRSLIGNGFHQNLCTTLQFDESISLHQKTLLVVETLPSHFFIDSFEMNDQMRLKNKISPIPHRFLIYPPQMDIEQPAYHSPPHFLFTTKDNLQSHRVTLCYPLHIRYEAPCEDGNAQVIIPSPSIFISTHNNLTLADIAATFREDHHTSTLLWQPPCSLLSQFHASPKLSVSSEVPCGLASHTQLIQYITTMLSVFGFLSVFLFIHKNMCI
jgi:hypothetical protein